MDQEEMEIAQSITDNQSKSTSFSVEKQIMQIEQQEESQNTQIWKLIPIYKQPLQQTKFILVGDAFINLDSKDEVKFIQTIRLQNSLRPVQYIWKDNNSNYIRIRIDSKAQGITDFRFLIHMMQSMQDQEMYKLSKQLEIYQILVNYDQQQVQELTLEQIQQKKDIFKIYQEMIIPQILHNEAAKNPYGIQVYELYNCIYSPIDSRKAEFGFNENYIHMIGSDQQTIQQFIIREGWFDQSQLLDSNSITQLFFEMFLPTLSDKEGEHKLSSFKYNMITLDQIIVPVIVQPVCYYLYSDLTYSIELAAEKINNVVGIFAVFNLDIEAKHIKRLVNIRKQKNTIVKNNLIFNTFDNTLSQFQYEIQAEFFYNKFYAAPLSEPIQKEQSRLNEQFPEKVCKFRNISNQL